jgi:hypothetical protein
MGRRVMCGGVVMLQACHDLERMDLEECVQITDATLSHLALNCPLLAKLVSAPPTANLSAPITLHLVHIGYTEKNNRNITKS